MAPAERGTLVLVLSSAEVLLPGVLFPGCVSAAPVQKVSDEPGKRPRAPGGRRGKQLREKEQIPLSHLMIFICVSVGAGALARSVALFSEMLCS